jgi:hypothetical protein
VLVGRVLVDGTKYLEIVHRCCSSDHDLILFLESLSVTP